MTLTCSVEGPNFPTFSIIWFRRTTNGTEELTNSQQGLYIRESSAISSENNATIRQSSNLGLTRTDINQVDNVNVGDFWCQVRLTNNGSLFQEKSNVLTLPTHNPVPSNLGVCRGSQSVDQVDCLTLPTMVPTTTDSGTPTSQTTGGSTEKSENHRTTLYIIIAVAVVFAVMILVFSIAISLIIWCRKQKHIARYCEKNGQLAKQETRSTTEHQPLEAETMAAIEHTREGFDFKENVAYNSSPVDKITVTENVAYGTAMPPRAASPLEAEYEEVDYY